MRKCSSLSFLILFTFLSAGCTTIYTLGNEEQNNKIFSGTIRQVELACGHAVCVDFPFSLVADVVLLPATIPWSIYNVSTNSAEKYKASKQPDVPVMLEKPKSE
ncbi:YceK/YidQ family lipoprotein [Colwellia sp. D2M02]|uniref:YceK/YidQ family lipoprotein n=1 Tax=Colwellia sp. D2M02 TaxID=2841562 RepID=UPI001C0934DB|nr:YceK/YidQ family lipoprotein [Colwellia sp. D2M02]MBU2893720.1 YceK/YidQ family lipoprotein [Colwellia sp. D2M02]